LDANFILANSAGKPSAGTTFFIWLVKEKLNLSYRRITKLLEELMIFRNTGIMKVPHFTTLQKF
jgi:hypothetical protein